MRRIIGLGLAFMLVLAAVPGVSGAGKPVAIAAIGIQSAELRTDVVGAESRTFVAFVETGSLDAHCLASLSETNIPGIVRSLYCAPRQIQGGDGRLMNGLFLLVLTDDVIPADAFVVVNFYQEHMVASSSPYPCDGLC
jgi:hypothetical protein